MALFLPSKFQQDIQGRNINLVPIVVIEASKPTPFNYWWQSLFLSTQSLDLKHVTYFRNVGDSEYSNADYNFKPLLLNVPSVKESISLDKRKHKINTITLNLSNMPYEGKRLSDRIAESEYITDTLKNTRVSIQWVSPSVKYFYTFGSENYGGGGSWQYKTYYDWFMQGVFNLDTGYSESFIDNLASTSFMAYSGVCTKYTHDDTKVTLTIEDRTELDFHQDLPIQNDTNWLSTDTSVPDKYRGKPKPMVYGYVDRSPCVLDANGQIIIDTKPIHQLVKLSNNVFGEYEPLYMASGDTMMSVSKKVEKDLGTMIDIEDDDLEDEVLVSAIGQEQWVHSNNDDEPADNIIQLNVTNRLISNKVLQCDARHKAVSISLVDRPDFKDNLISSDEIALISDGDNSTGVNLNHTADYDFTASADHTGDSGTVTLTYHKLILSVKPSISDSLSSRTNQVAINGILLPNPNLVSGNNGTLTTDDEGNVETSASAIYIYPIELGTTGAGSYSNVAIGTPYSLKDEGQDQGYDLRSLFGFPNKHNVFDYNYYSPNGSKYIDIYNSATSNDIALANNHTLPALFFYDFCGMSDAKTQVNNGEYVIYFRHHNYISSLSEGDNFESSIELRNANINEVDVKSYIDVENIYQKQFFTTVRGRIGNNSANSYLRQPTEIITNIIREVKNDPDYEPERRALDSGYENGFSGFINDFTVHKKIGSKKLIENILSTSPFIGRFANNGKFVFNEIPKRGGTPLYTIKEEDVINFSFIKTEDIYTKVILKSKINYLTNEFENITEASVRDLLGSQYDYNYYGLLDDDSQSTLIVDDDRGKYIRNIDAAERLAYWLLSYYANSHLKLKVDLPLNYLNAEVGDTINFNRLIQGIKPYGINYVKDGEMLNGQVIFPTFIITSTVKTLDKITIECIQNHALATQGCEEGFDCFGECGGTAELDVCGVCDGGETDITNCEVCPEEAIDCNGVCGGTAVRDACGTCEGTCDGTPTGDCDYECGCADIPEGNCDCNGNVEDCNGVCGGEAYIDNCGNCVGGTTDAEPCLDDCSGEAGGNATVEICGYCTPEGTDVDECWNEFYIQIEGYYPLNNLHLKELEITFSTGNILNANSIVVENNEMQIQQPPNLNWQVPSESFLEDKRLWKDYYLQGGDFELLPDEYRTYGDGETKISIDVGEKITFRFEHPELILQAGTIAQHLFRFPKTENSTEIEIDSVKIVHDTGSGGSINLHDIPDAITFEKTQSAPSWSSTEINKHIIDVKVPDEYSNDGGIVVGDLNNDGQFNVLDIVNLANKVLTGDQYTASGDMNGDGSLNVLDVVTLANCVLSGTCTGEVE
jgi:hypothetical protein